MFTDGPRPRRAPMQPLAVLFAMLCLALLSFGANSAAGSSQPVASSAALRTAITARAAADQTFVSSLKALDTCLRIHPHGCQADRRTVQRARGQVAGLDGRVARYSRGRGHKRASNPSPPTSTNPAGLVSSPTEAGSTSTPTPESPTGTGSGSGSGGVGGSTGTPGLTGNSGGSTEGGSSGGSTENTGSGSGGGSTEGTGNKSGGSTEPSEPSNPSGTGGQLELGINAGSALDYELPFIQKLGAHTARMAFGVNESVSAMEPIIEAYARAGVKPLLLACFTGYVPNSTEAKNVANWAAAFGPGGTFWQGKHFPASDAVTDIEFGNETNYSYQFSEDTPAAYATRAQTYATRVKEAQESIQATHTGVGILAQGGLGNAGPAWMQNMFKAVPNLGQLIAGWTIHPYGPNWEQQIDATISAAQAAGAPSTVPIYVTEWGLSSDNGRCLEYNFGFNDCMTYSEAASTLASNVAAMRAKYGSRLGGFYLYQAHDQKPTGGSTEMEGYFGGLQSNGEPKGAYTTEVESLFAEDA